MQDPESKYRSASTVYKTAIGVCAVCFLVAMTLQWGTAGFLFGIAGKAAFVARVARRDRDEAREEMRRQPQ